MFSTRIRELVQGQWAGLVALFLVLTGGTAYALVGSNTVFSDDIVNGEVRTMDLAPNSVQSGRVQDDSLFGIDVNEATFDPTVLQRRVTGTCPPGASIRAIGSAGAIASCESTGLTKTISFPADGVRRTLFFVGGTRVIALCELVADPGPEQNGVSRQLGVIAGPQGAHLTDGQGGSNELSPNESEVFILDAIPPGGRLGAITTFAVFDGGGAVASGVGAILADPGAASSGDESCIATAQADG